MRMVVPGALVDPHLAVVLLDPLADGPSPVPSSSLVVKNGSNTRPSSSEDSVPVSATSTTTADTRQGSPGRTRGASCPPRAWHPRHW